MIADMTFYWRRSEYSATLGCALIIRDMTVSCKAHGKAVNQGGTADISIFVLDRLIWSVKDFFVILQTDGGAFL